MTEFKDRIIGIDRINPNDIKLNPSNHRKHPDEQRNMMNGILSEIGWIQTVIVNKNTGNLIDGEMRVTNAIANGETSIPVIYVDLTPEEELKALGLFDPVSVFAKEDRKKLLDILENVSYQNIQVKDMVDRVAQKNKLEFSAYGKEVKTDKEKLTKKKEDQDAMREELVEKWGVKPGQVWVIPSQMVEGSHRLACGDSNDPAIVKKLMVEGVKPVLMVTDPPYGVSFEARYNPRQKPWDGISNDERRGDDLQSWVASVLNNWIKYMDKRSAFYLWSASFDEGYATLRGMRDAGIHIQSTIVWVKNHFSLGMSDYHWKHEICWYGYFEGENHIWYGGRNQSTVWDVKLVPTVQYLHPMQKPTELYAIPIKNHSTAGDVVVDPFNGCGTQIVAAEQHGRLCYACELDPTWVAVSLDRFSKLGLVPQLEEE